MLTENASREFTRSMWPLWAVTAVLALATVVLQVLTDGWNVSLWLPVCYVLAAAVLALGMQQGWLPLRRRRRPGGRPGTSGE